MTTPTCTVCGAAEQPGRDHTCPVCGADLPEVPATSEPPETTSDAPTSEPPTPEAPAPDAPAPGGSPHEVPPAPPSWPAAAAPAAPPPPGAAPPPSGAAPPPLGAAPPPPGGGTAGAPAQSPYDPSHPSGLSSSVRTYGMLTHLSAFLGAMLALAFVGPLVMWLIRRDEHPFLDHHGKEALNFNLSMLLYLVIGFVASLATLGLGLVIVVPAAIVFFVTWVVTTITGAVKANAGEGYRYPLTIRFIQD